jgi:hypothetical protein
LIIAAIAASVMMCSVRMTASMLRLTDRVDMSIEGTWARTAMPNGSDSLGVGAFLVIVIA